MSSAAFSPSDDYQAPPAPAPARLDREAWNRVLGDVGRRLRALEAKRTELQGLIDDLSFNGQARLDESITPLIDAQRAILTTLAANIDAEIARINTLFTSFEAATQQALAALDQSVADAMADANRTISATIAAIDAKVKAVSDRVDTILSGGLPAADVQESATRVFVTPAQKTKIGEVDAKAPILSPNFTGNPRAPTRANTTNDSLLATTQFVRNLLAGADAVPGLVMRAPTKPRGTRSTEVANTDYVEDAVAEVAAIAEDTRYRVGDVLLTRRTPGSQKWRAANGAAYLRSAFPALYELVKGGILPAPDMTTAGVIPAAPQRLVKFGSLYVMAQATSGRDGVITSPTLSDWTARTVFSTNSATFESDLAVGNGVIVLATGCGHVGNAQDNGSLYSSANGTAWTRRVEEGGCRVSRGKGVAFGNGIFVAAFTHHYAAGNGSAINTNGQYLTSVDGINWTRRNFGSPGQTGSVRGVEFVGGYFIISTSTGFAYSQDGVSWQFVTAASAGNNANRAFLIRGAVHLFPPSLSNGFSSSRRTTDFTSFATGYSIQGDVVEVFETVDNTYFLSVVGNTWYVSVIEGDNPSLEASASYAILTTGGGTGPRPFTSSVDVRGIVFHEGGTYEFRTLDFRPVSEFRVPSISISGAASYIRVLD